MTPNRRHRRMAVLGAWAALSAWVAAAEPPSPGEDLRNRPFRMVQTEPIRYPLRLLQEGVLYGEARLVFHIDRDGRLVDALALAYSARPFADAALETLRRWKFVPPLVDGEPGASVVHLSVRFEINGVVAIERMQPPSLDVSPDRPAGTFVYEPCVAAALDRPLRPVTVVPPDYPGEVRRQGVGGLVPVIFYVDETGRPRMVVAAPGSHPLLANFAIAAVEQWRFEPPTSRGRPVLVHASQEFRFVPAPGPEAVPRK